MSRANQNNLIRDLLQAVQDIGRQNKNQPPPLPPAPVAHPTHASIVELFQRHKPLTFDRASGPLVVKEWFRKLERIFRLIDCTDAQRVHCAEFMFTGDASYW